ncbi:MAG: DUF2516 family protein [Actinobacteria bacterium]|nr:DUF2516 family protein [Actinomycetota bacterium]
MLALIFISVLQVFSLISCTSEDAATAAIGTAAAVPVAIWFCFVAIAWLVGIFFFVIWIITLVDCAKRENEDFPGAGENTKLLWILIIVFAGGIGAIIYYFLVMKKMPRKK